MLAVMLRRRMQEAGMDTGGVEPSASHRRRGAAGHPLVDVAPADEFSRADRLPDDAVVERLVRHRRGGRIPGEVPGNAAPVADLAATIAQTMSKPVDLPDLWTHEPHDYLVYRQGDKVANIDTSATPGFKGEKGRSVALQTERETMRLAEHLQEMLYANGRRRRTPLGAAGAAGHGHRGQGRDRPTRDRPHGPAGRRPRGVRGADRRRRRRTTTCGGSTRHCPARAGRRLRPVALRGRAGGAGAQPGAARRSGNRATTRSTTSRRNWSSPGPR